MFLFNFLYKKIFIVRNCDVSKNTEDSVHASKQACPTFPALKFPKSRVFTYHIRFTFQSSILKIFINIIFLVERINKTVAF